MLPGLADWASYSKTNCTDRFSRSILACKVSFIAIASSGNVAPIFFILTCTVGAGGPASILYIQSHCASASAQTHHPPMTNHPCLPVLTEAQIPRQHPLHGHLLPALCPRPIRSGIASHLCSDVAIHLCRGFVTYKIAKCLKFLWYWKVIGSIFFFKLCFPITGASSRQWDQEQRSKNLATFKIKKIFLC